MATVETVYVGGFRTENIHLQSGTKILTDAPTDNQGRGEAFSPTDLLATSLGTCMLTTMAIRTAKDGIDLDGAKCSITKIMAANPRRVAEIAIKFEFPAVYTDEQKKLLADAALTCPVYYSLHTDLVKTVDFGW
ncbi:osmotically inducible protein OsmC [Mucilaginibacter sp. PPCGB 2223]|uniref:OsmC family protein n=1 Tax=Mucilaginibacter sp. PPCGB 2223 TaxID=1886027 RepID=UPI00082451B1|nr:OsmC family protein [Mucilaginibacter sp. PPCGB 2223]OCX52441.1 osmotically inducible protein OsmC [Mucilaginibacter sp. PPCGB 2223]